MSDIESTAPAAVQDDNIPNVDIQGNTAGVEANAEVEANAPISDLSQLTLQDVNPDLVRMLFQYSIQVLLLIMLFLLFISCIFVELNLNCRNLKMKLKK